MSFCRIALATMTVLAAPGLVFGQDNGTGASVLSIELNAVQDVENACRLSFLAQNRTGEAIDEAVFETVIFDTGGGVVSLSLFDFRSLPADRPRVRQFDLPGRSCDMVGQALINGANTCLVAGAESDLCDRALDLSSRVSVELIG